MEPHETPPSPFVADLVARLLRGEKRAAARLITLVEDAGPSTAQAVALLHAHTGRAHVIGITGPPGAGKSTLVLQLAREFRQKHDKVGIVAVDPTSPFSGGALLGDRVRMMDLYNDPGVFIRSMATRGSLGGLSAATRDAVRVLDAYGCPIILVETVGAGQSEVEIAAEAHTTIVVLPPGLGDDIQAIKAGILEIADIYAINKADLGGADRVAAELKAMMRLSAAKLAWEPPIIQTIATTRQGVPELVRATGEHFAYLQTSAKLHTLLHDHARAELLDLARDRVLDAILRAVPAAELDQLVAAITDRDADPYAAARQLVDRAGIMLP